MKLDLSSLEKAVGSLEIALTTYDKAVAPDGSPEKETIRAGVIQRFEYTFELSWKMIKRYIEMYSLEKPDTFTNKDLFRVGAEKGLLRDAGKWLEYLKKRNLTSHTYDEVVSKDVYESAREFLRDARFLLERLKKQAV